MNPGPGVRYAPAGSATWRGNSDDCSSLRQALVGRPARIASSSRQKMRRKSAMPASDYQKLGLMIGRIVVAERLEVAPDPFVRLRSGRRHRIDDETQGVGASSGTFQCPTSIQGSLSAIPGTTMWFLLGKVQSRTRTLFFERVAICRSIRRSLMLWQRGRNFPSCVHNSLHV
jgi:hypothetical protein